MQAAKMPQVQNCLVSKFRKKGGGVCLLLNYAEPHSG